MKHPLRHSHIAIRRALSSLAKPVEANISSGEDDLGHYRFFDLTVSQQDGTDQRVRFASHDGDKMTHLLAERIDKTSDLAAALYRVGISNRSDALSISTDREGRPLRDEREIQDSIAAISKSSSAEAQEPNRKVVGPHRQIWKGPFIDGYLLKKVDKVREGGRKEVMKMWSRRSTILPQFVGFTFSFRYGHERFSVSVDEDMVGHKFGEFAPDRPVELKPSDQKKLSKK